MFSPDDTIAAIATPLGPGGIGIIRISGVEAPHILSRLFRRYRSEESWQSHRLYLGLIVEPRSGALLDEALAMLMRAPHTYTREQMAELQCHGGPAVLSQVLAACITAGARLAERGEFTLRAFLNGALSLDEAEAVADLVSARTASGAQMAARQLQGALKQRLAPLEQELLDILTAITVGVDFPEDSDAPAAADLLPRLNALRCKIAQLLAGAEAGRIYREGYSVVLAGAVNVGKSSLLNRLLQTERAIVTAEAGATRDIIEEALNVEGLPLLLTDTAGLRDTTGLTEAEAQGIRRCRTALATAQLTLVVTDGLQGLDEMARALLDDPAQAGYMREEPAGALVQKERPSCMLLLNKADLLSAEELQARLAQYQEQYPAHSIAVVSAKTGAGLAELLVQIKDKAMAGLAESGSSPLLNNIRHQQALLRADVCLQEAQATLADNQPLDLVAIDLENAYQAVGEISGKTVSEEVLVNIFANFCVGK
jgi:tRNA modification GTPase